MEHNFGSCRSPKPLVTTTRPNQLSNPWFPNLWGESTVSKLFPLFSFPLSEAAECLRETLLVWRQAQDKGHCETHLVPCEREIRGWSQQRRPTHPNAIYEMWERNWIIPIELYRTISNLQPIEHWFELEAVFLLLCVFACLLKLAYRSVVEVLKHVKTKCPQHVLQFISWYLLSFSDGTSVK